MIDPIREAVEAAARQLCICDGECFETRHGMMHGPCEQDFTRARRAIAAFHKRMAEHWCRCDTALH
ncbi:MAG: hypothetical protein KAX84_21420 [Burkholderiales bacterium]|nr:hypothetical protein [Burkholderiales bacterium]